jgi:hypothetical protein
MPLWLGWIGAAGLAGMTGSTQRVEEPLQASWPMLAWYQSTRVALLPAAWVASIAFSSFCFERR